MVENSLEPSRAQRASVVEAFVLRARRVLAHSLACDEDGLARIAGGATYVTKTDGKKVVEQRLPDEELLESLASRVRPLLLKRERVHYDRVMNSQRALLLQVGEDGLAEECLRLKRLWRSVDPATGAPTYLTSVSTQGSGEPATEMADGVLATAWFYGDLVHADQHDTSSSFGIETRFAAAAVRVAQVALTAHDTLALIRYCHEQGIVILDESAFGTDVVVGDGPGPIWDLYLAGPGATTPTHDEDFGPEWHRSAAWDDEDEGEWFVHIGWGLDAESD